MTISDILSEVTLCETIGQRERYLQLMDVIRSMTYMSLFVLLSVRQGLKHTYYPVSRL